MAPPSNRDLREIRRLADHHRIAFLPPVSSSDQWPSAHRMTFENIGHIGELRFDSFCASIDIHSADQPWRRQTKTQAGWLADRANRLVNQERNEAGWRFSLENDVLQRFSFEVACPKCRARIWRSEFEAYIKEPDSAIANLDERRRNRIACQCPPEHRPLDRYEFGINSIFDDRAQQAFIHDPVVRSDLSRMEPDRVYGLQATRNFQKLLSEPAVGSSLDGKPHTIGERITTSPFKEEVDPLLFPFLIVEAKSAKSPNSFEDIKTQTAFPIFDLLKIQEHLQVRMTNSGSDSSPLVWFLASRGDAWRVYGCYVSASNPPRYEIVQLWSGCIQHKDNALRLLLIVDYIFDWARDVYRPSILRQLGSLTTGKAYDMMSLPSDSNILSLHKNIANWIPPPPSTVRRLSNSEMSTIPGTLAGYSDPGRDTRSSLQSTLNYSLGDKDTEDVLCILHPISAFSHITTYSLHNKDPQCTVSRDKAVLLEVRNLDAPQIMAVPSYDILLRLSSKSKHQEHAFYFGRSKEKCDVICDSSIATACDSSIAIVSTAVNHIHFGIQFSVYGDLFLEDRSTNGTAVDGNFLFGNERNSHQVQALEHGSIIAFGHVPEEVYLFSVTIPQRDISSKNAFQDNLTLFFSTQQNSAPQRALSQRPKAIVIDLTDS